MVEADLYDWLGNVAKDVRQSSQRFRKNIVKGCPIPFFGNVLRAHVLTVGVNPSHTEFAPSRDWKEPLKRDAWRQRLLRYFEWPGVPPNAWFETWSICLELLGFGYAAGDAAHIDVSPRPTKPMLDRATDKKEFREMAEHDVKWLFELLNALPQIRLLLVAGPIPRADGSKQQLAHFIGEQAKAHGAGWRLEEPLPMLVTPNHREGIPVFVCPYEAKVDGLYAMVRQIYRHRQLLRRLAGPSARSVPATSAQLDWSSVIGNFITNFGILDLHVQDFLESLLPPEEFSKAKERPFFDRVELTKQRLQAADCRLTKKAEFLQFFHRLDPLRETRNHIAHSILRIGLAADQKTFIQTLSLPRDLDGSEACQARHLEFAELQAELKTLTELIEEFQRLTGFKDGEGVAKAGM